ncbi:hypothetical protein BKA93DRAFT_785315 [Sparassis latifolia]
MCCNGYSLSSTANDVRSVHVNEQLVATPLPDGYWLHAFPYSKDSKLPDIVGYGLGFQGKPATIKLFHNPENIGSQGWKVSEIQSLDFPVAMAYADLTGSGFNDIIICDRYGPSMSDLWDAKTKDGGRIQWLKNPGPGDTKSYWEAHHIGNSTGMHRLQVGHFTRHDFYQVLAIPIISASKDLKSPAPVIVYSPTYGSDQRQGPQSWTEDILFPSEFRLIHEVKLLNGGNNGLDMALVAGREGIVLLWFDEDKKKWRYNVVGKGLPQDVDHDNPYWGSGSVDVVRVGSDHVGYIASCEAFHGNVVSVYIKDNSKAPQGAASLMDCSLWKRVVIDDFGPLDSKEHTGTIHNVVSVKVGDSDIDSFAIACMGAPVGKAENQGVYLYTPVDLAQGRFDRIRITAESAGRLAIAGFTDPKRLDIASISYYVPGYLTGPDPPSIRINAIEPYHITSRESIVATKLDKEVLLRVPRPNAVPDGCVPAMPLITIGGKKLTLVVLRPKAQMKLGHGDWTKVIYGSIKMTDESGKTDTRTIAPTAKQVATTCVLSRDGIIVAGENGTVFLHVEPLDQFQGPFTKMSQVTAQNIFPRAPEVPADVKAMEFPFIRVEKLPWANSGLWNDFEFYNMTGFYVYFNDDAMQRVVHIQAWTLGIGETARFHNHTDKSFCEIHYCLSNGGGLGGMRYFADSNTEPININAELTKEYVEKNSTLLVVPSMYEHGPLWKIQPGTQATPKLRPNDTVDYPWHAWLASNFGEQKLPIKPPLDEKRQRFDLWMA